MARGNWGQLAAPKAREYRDRITYEDGTSEPVEYYQGADEAHAIACTNPETAPCWYVFERVGRCGWRLDHVNPVEPRDVREIARRRKLMAEHWTLYPATDKAALGGLMHAVWHELAYVPEEDGPEPAAPERETRIDLDAIERAQEPQPTPQPQQPKRTRFLGLSVTFDK